MRNKLVLGTITLLWVAVLPLNAADQTVRYKQSGGSKMRIEGTSNIHDWRAASPLILGFLEAGPGFPTDSGQEVKPGKVEAHGQAVVLTGTIQSKKENWVDHYEDKMDDNMYRSLKAGTPAGSNIVFQLSELTLKEAPKSKDTPYVFESKGDLVIAGVTNKVTMPLNISFVPDEKRKITKLKISGSTPIKMTDYKVEPFKVLAGLFTVGDEVKVSFDWMLEPQKPAAAASANK